MKNRDPYAKRWLCVDCLTPSGTRQDRCPNCNSERVLLSTMAVGCFPEKFDWWPDNVPKIPLDPDDPQGEDAP